MGQESVLLVDDDAPIRRMLERTLAAEGYRVEAAPDGGAALAAVERSMPDAIVLDVTMPGLDGLAVTRRLRDKGHAVPILLLTARDALHERVAGLDAGADDYLVKPFEVEELAARVRALLRRNQPPGEQLAFADLTLEPASRNRAARGPRALPHGPGGGAAGAAHAQPARGRHARGRPRARLGRRGRGERERRRPLRRLPAPQARGPAAHPHRARRRLPARRVSRFSLRARLALGAVAAIAVAVAVLGVAVTARLDRQLDDALDDALQARAVEVARLAATTPAVLSEPGSLEGRLGGSPLFVQVVDHRGRIVARSSGLGSRVLPDTGAARTARVGRAAGFGDDALGTDAVRLYAAPLGELSRGPAAGGAVIVAGTTAAIDTTLDTTRRFVVVSAIAAALVAGLLAVVLAAGALRPLRRLSEGARRIERSGDAAARLPAPAARDEVGELAQTLNAMLASLERARAAERRFVADASHELRTPLTALRGNAAYVARHGADPAALADLEADAARLGALLDDLLALAREDACRAAAGEPVDLAALARAAAAAEPAVRLGALDGRPSSAARRPPWSGRSATSSPTRASTARRAARSSWPRAATAGRRGSAWPTRARASRPASRPTPSSASGAGAAPAARALGWASRSCARSPSVTAAV